VNRKKDFPIFANNKGLVYLDSAATSQKPQVVIDAIREYYEKYNANVRRGLYPLSEKATAKVEEIRQKVAKFINAKDSSEIIFVRNATEALNALAYAIEVPQNQTITTTVMEHHSNFVPWQVLAARTDSSFQVVDIDENYGLRFSDSDLKKSKIFTVAHISNVLGITNPIEDIRKNFKGNLIIDAAQSIPHMKIDVQKMNCDFLVFSGHKMLAGTGIGVLYGKKEKLRELSPFLFGGEMIREVTIEQTTFEDPPHKFEAGTLDIAGIVSLGAAIEYLEDFGMDALCGEEEKIMKYALEQMSRIEDLEIYGPKNSAERKSVISFNLKNVHGHDAAQILGDMGICIRAGHHCAMPLHKRLGISASARISFSVYNDEEDIDAFIQGLTKVKKIFK
jgi:cysteine desulfurase / selenocysteine lyase